MKVKIINLCILSTILALTACGSKQNETIPEPEMESPSIEASKEEDAADSLPETEKDEGKDKEADAPEQSEPVETISRTINQSNLSAFFADSATEPVPFSLTLVSEKGNNISEVEDWYVENELYLPMANGPLAESAKQIQIDSAIDYNRWQSVNTPVFFDDNYIYQWSTENVIVFDKQTAQVNYIVQISSDWWTPMGNCAYMEDGILYIGSIHNGYAMENSCYLMAYDVENDTVLWRSEDQTYNSQNFIVKDGIIICGYGFTAEPDYIYQINMYTGKVLSKTPVAKMPDLLVEKDGRLYVHTYSYDYVFDIE